MTTTKFTSSEEIRSEPSDVGEKRVVKLETPQGHDVHEFKMNPLAQGGHGTYAAVKAKFGALAATDADRAGRTQKDSRFAISPLLRGSLSVEEEERRAVEERVRARVAALEAEACERATQQGFDEGLKQGHDKAFQKFQADAAELLQKFEAFLSDCENAKQEIYKANEKFLIELVFRIAKTILLRELATDQAYVAKLAGDLIERVGVRENIKVKIAPEAMQTASMLKESLEKQLGALKNVQIEASNEARSGGCVVETEWNAIDATIETQLRGLHEALLGTPGGEKK